MLGFFFAKEVFSTVPRLPFTEKSQGFDEPQSGRMGSVRTGPFRGRSCWGPGLGGLAGRDEGQVSVLHASGLGQGQTLETVWLG